MRCCLVPSLINITFSGIHISSLNSVFKRCYVKKVKGEVHFSPYRCFVRGQKGTDTVLEKKVFPEHAVL